METISNFCTILTWRTAVVMGLSLLATYFCEHKKITADLPTTLIGIAVVFPIVFSINAAYRRREDALKSLASIKANIVSLAFAARDWTPNTSGQTDPKSQTLPSDLFCSITRALRDSTQDNFDAVYRVFSQWSRHHEVLRQAGVSGSEISRANQYLRITIMDFEKMRNISSYRTPITLRAYSKIFLHVIPIAFAPHFAYMMSNPPDNMRWPQFSGYFAACLYAMVFVCLDVVQDRLEQPFDQDGVDDVQLEVTDHYKPVLSMGATNED